MGNKINNKLVMFYTKDINKSEKIINLCKRLDIHTRKIKPSDMNMEVGNLAGIKAGGMNKGKKQVPTGYDMPEVMIFSGISDKNLDVFLEEYKKENIVPIALKAILTPYNISWSLYELVTELERERIEMMFGRK